MPIARQWIALLAVSAATACQGETPPGQTYFDRVIAPILDQSCSRGSSGCHAADPGDPNAFAAGNLDTTSYVNILKRRDTLRNHGAYPVPFLLAKAVGETTALKIVYRSDQQLPLEIPHAGGKVFTVGSPAFLTLQEWMINGARQDGVKQPPAPVLGTGDCTTKVPDEFNEAEVTGSPQWAAASGDFDAVQQVLTDTTCSAGNCHGATQSDFFLTCGSDARQRVFNFRQVWAFVGDPIDRSDILWLPVANGAQHAGGAHFTGPDDPRYLTLKAFGEKVGVYAPPRPGPQQFFEDRVMPVLLKRGCAAEGCHSPAAMNDFKMRSGSPGFFSAIALEKNYRLAKDEFMAFEVTDVRRSRLVAKNLFPQNGGIAHRGGPLLEVGGGAANPASCGAYDPATSSAFCTIAEWARLERADEGNHNAGGLTVVYVERDSGKATSLLDITAFDGPGDLRAADVPVGAGGAIGAFTNSRSLLGGCGLSGADVRGPDVKFDGETVVFSAKRNAGARWELFTVHTDGSACAPLFAEADVDNFDPAWSPDGEWVVYASTKAGGMSKRLNLPQSDLWRIRADGSAAERMTFLSNSELGPQFMREGRLTMTTEKVDARDPTGGFYQLAGRRLNWDITDYHPLLGQRAESPIDPADPSRGAAQSIGFAQATEIREVLDGNFLVILSAAGAPGTAGALGIFNRSIGPFERGRTDPGYLQSVVTFDPGGGAFRSPFLLPDGRILVSYSASAGLDFDLVAVDPKSPAADPVTLLGGGRSQLEAVLALSYEPRKPYLNRRQLVFGGQQTDDRAHATVYVPDLPMIATLLGANLRRGRNAAGFRAATELMVFDASGARVGSVPLAADGSVKIRAPSGLPVYLGAGVNGNEVFRMSEEHQFGPGENIALGVREAVFDQVCGGCHGSVSGREIDVGVSPDALTGASESLSRAAAPTPVGP